MSERFTPREVLRALNANTRLTRWAEFSQVVFSPRERHLFRAAGLLLAARPPLLGSLNSARHLLAGRVAADEAVTAEGVEVNDAAEATATLRHSWFVGTAEQVA